MESAVISGLSHHFHHNTFGRNAHQAQDPSAHDYTQQQSSVTPGYRESSRPHHSRASASTDTPMSDSGHRAHSSTASSGHGTSQHRSSSHASSHTSESTPHASQPQQRPDQFAPPSPRFTPQRHVSASQQGSGIPRAMPSASSSAQQSPARSTNTLTPSRPSPHRIKVRDLQHIQSFATEEMAQGAGSRAGRQGSDDEPVTQYEISEMPVTDIIEMVAGLLTKITATNDRQHEHLHKQIPPVEGTSGLSQQTSSVLAFHGKNVPSITIMSYLSRIHRYCPTTYEVFLALLVYFDRMAVRVNSGPLQSLRQNANAQHHAVEQNEHGSPHSSVSSATLVDRAQVTPPPSGSLGRNPHNSASSSHLAQEQHLPSPPHPPENAADPDSYNLSHFFVVDSFNIHRLVIAGVTCASKFFSDIFYTNSRYAKVGGLPLVELNHLELQFLLLNDFRLSVPLEEMQAYGTMLVEFYAREVVSQRRAQEAAAH